MHSRLQFGTRENTAPSRQHASRTAVCSSSSPEPRKDVEAICQPQLEGSRTEICTLLTDEPFVSADQAAKFLSVKRRYLLELARRGIARAYALGTGSKRKIWVFRLSELAASVVRNETSIPKPPKPCTIGHGSPR